MSDNDNIQIKNVLVSKNFVGKQKICKQNLNNLSSLKVKVWLV